MSGPHERREPRPPNGPEPHRPARELLSASVVFALVTLVVLAGGLWILGQVRAEQPGPPPAHPTGTAQTAAPTQEPGRTPTEGPPDPGEAPVPGFAPSRGPVSPGPDPADGPAGGAAEPCSPGSLDVNAPPRMTWRQSAAVLARVSFRSPAAEPTDPLPGEGETVRVPAPACRSMSAELLGPGFTVSPEGPSAMRRVTEDEPAVWVWTVTPEQPGPGTLYLNLYTVGPDGATGKKIHVQHIDVVVPLTDRASTVIGEWLAPLGIGVTAVAAGLGGARTWWARMRRRRAPSRPAPWDQGPPNTEKHPGP